MKLLSNLPIDIRDYCGCLVVTLLDSDAESCVELFRMLDEHGYQYIVDRFSAEALLRRNYLTKINSDLDRCACLVPVITDNFFKEENSIYRSMFWYKIGYVRALSENAIVPLFLGKNSSVLSSSPMKNANYASTASEVIDTLAARYASKLIKSNYYEDMLLNRYASRRIDFHRLTLSMRIFEDAFDLSREYLQEYTGIQYSPQMFDSFIKNNLVCGCTAVSFGSEETLVAQLYPYKEEMHPVVTDYPKTFAGRKTYRLLSDAERGQTGVRAEVTMDILVPVHKLFGLYFKAYLACVADDCPLYILLSLVLPDFANNAEARVDDIFNREQWEKSFPDETYIDEKKQRLYFGLGFKKRPKTPTPAPSLNLGLTLDYLYPQ